jgi:hypothetical protein
VRALGSFWELAQDDVGRWMRRILMVAGWSLAISAPLIVTGYSFLIAAGVPAYLGTAWMAALLAGLITIIGGLEAASASPAPGIGQDQNFSSFVPRFAAAERQGFVTMCVGSPVSSGLGWTLPPDADPPWRDRSPQRADIHSR